MSSSNSPTVRLGDQPIGSEFRATECVVLSTLDSLSSCGYDQICPIHTHYTCNVDRIFYTPRGAPVCALWEKCGYSTKVRIKGFLQLVTTGAPLTKHSIQKRKATLLWTSTLLSV